MFRPLLVLPVVLCLAIPTHARAKDSVAQKYIDKGSIAEGEKALLTELKTAPADDELRFSLAVLQFLRGVEGLCQDMYRAGLRSGINLPFLRVPVGTNPKPDKLTYDGLRKIFQTFHSRLELAEQTLAPIRDDKLKVTIYLGKVRLDFDGDGKPEEPLTALIDRYLGRPKWKTADLKVCFDRGDVAWLRGYCHLLMGLQDMILGLDMKEWFECCGHIAFANIDTPHKFLLDPKLNRNLFGTPVENNYDITDLIASIHLLRFPVKEKKRLESALKHFEQVVAMSKESWKHILAETDDEDEWIPSPTQKNGALGVPVRRVMVDNWQKMLDEIDGVLKGKVLVPFWRSTDGRGINLRRVFTDPRTFDVILWVQGTAATPYLEKGKVTDREVWDRLMRAFGGEFLGFAIWFN